jgi:hypothetical protein
MRHEGRRIWKDLAQISDENRQVDYPLTAVNKPREDPVRIDVQILRAKLIAGKQLKLEGGEWKALLTKGNPSSLATGGLQRVVYETLHGIVFGAFNRVAFLNCKRSYARFQGSAENSQLRGAAARIRCLKLR